MKLNQREYLEAVARETARMSFPGRMGGILNEGAKGDLERYFAEGKFPIGRLWKNPPTAARSFEQWHRKRTRDLASVLVKNKLLKRGYRPTAVASKLMDTFHYQLLKYDRFRTLREHLHLPVDRRVIKKLRSLARTRNSPALKRLQRLSGGKKQKNPYGIQYDDYSKIQKALLELLREWRVGRKKLARIDLNALLWAYKNDRRHRAPVAGRRSLGTPSV